MAQALASRTGDSRKQVILNGLIGIMVGANALKNRRVTEMTREFVSSFIKLL